MVKNLIQQKEVKTAIKLKEYEDTLLNKKVIRHKMRRIQSKKHKIYTYEIKRISLLCFDDKRFLLNDGIYTLAYFHKDIRKQILTDGHRDFQRCL